MFEYTILYFGDVFTATLEHRIVPSPVSVGSVFSLDCDEAESWSKIAGLSAAYFEWRVTEVRIYKREVNLIVVPIAEVTG